MKIELDTVELTHLIEEAKIQLRLVQAAPPPQLASHFSRDQLVKLSQAFVDYAVRGNKINAIKIVREVTGLGLKEAKDIVEGNYF